MNASKKRVAALLLTIAFAATTFSVTTLAAQTDPGGAGDNLVSEFQPGDAGSEPGVASDLPTQGDPESTPDGTSSVDGATSEVVSELPSESVADAPSSMIESNHPASSQAPVSSKAPVKNPDTKPGKVESAAAAASAISDPDVLSSQDWGSILNSGAEEESTVSTGLGGTVQPDPLESTPDNKGGTTSGGFTWLLWVGILLIVLALGGIGFFVYSQFFRDETHRNTLEPLGPDGDDGLYADQYSSHEGTYAPDSYGEDDFPQEEGMEIPMNDLPPDIVSVEEATPPAQPEFQDIYSTGDIEVPTVPSNGVVEEISSSSVPRPVSPAARQQPPAQKSTPAPKAQAKPVEQPGDKKFDWNDFFNQQ